MAYRRIAGEGARLAAGMGDSAPHILRQASTRAVNQVLDDDVLRRSADVLRTRGADAVATAGVSDLDPAFGRAVSSWWDDTSRVTTGDVDILRRATEVADHVSDAPLYRGVSGSDVSFDSSLAARGADVVDFSRLQVGSEFNMGLSSWTTDAGAARNFASYGDEAGTVFSVQGGRGMSFGPNVESEWLMSGRYRVSSIEEMSDSAQRMVHLEPVTDNSPVRASINVANEDAAEALSELRALSEMPTRPYRPAPPSPDQSLMGKPQHSSARYGLPKRSKG